MKRTIFIFMLCGYPFSMTAFASDVAKTIAVGDASLFDRKTREQVYCELVDARRRGVAPIGRTQYPLDERDIQRNRTLYQIQFGTRDYCADREQSPSETREEDRRSGNQ
ncbi:DUF4148 domain-containing protein [Burkholderia alba]|uniref:DUF4148 domain-containing protein n=1 Tax=Burkholderia alba TaxID=2683677 RepID=UPI002B052BBC|nr:DUF4148 domain-containing protein [Burkholderia alba]